MLFKRCHSSCLGLDFLLLHLQFLTHLQTTDHVTHS